MVELRRQLALEPMREADVPTVQEIERRIFSTPWPRNAYYRELSSRNSAYYVVLHRDLDRGVETVGYGGMWRMYDEAHVTTIGVRQDAQHQGYGRIIFAGLVQAAYDLGAKWVTLEVRASNDNAMRMYENFGFKVIGRRKGYYTDNGEDAIVMWSDSIYSPRFRKAFELNLARIEVDVRGLRREPLRPK
ncbi:MAG: ribosomal-protein-alanine N-acetyltransferase [Candidatus Nephthysia bennettiae]|uniref:Ribosomal protein S18-alanine N-acetyltransferase n=1 Tax=Candidatus Nephthysia bennettiae TaxID=3127016 RepID=A0A934N385_9BACT|nr:ribosomal protein S18-alanine N-acetyltransferase [Candidatus Dormibacteraeota bacterium]MBJ7610903.1 ribosomal protein S18-alanine N-acetyltransferase [Candidatus Dormibacteraeota bacterium]PZR89580.1 MAG: ribosomal-protein-alanine N-acetyltransferase [Candidatus Dormibacteraeota bacterium]